jgi:3D (Asp-Asp-Asp) domain-containing protein/peptidoglycan hydrolase CwlO-like protein
MRTLRIWPAVLGALLALVALLPGTVEADSAGSLRQRASELSRQNTNLAAKSRSALLDLYALDSRLARERAHVVALRIRTADVRGELAAARQRVRVAQQTLSVSQLALAKRLQLLYEQGDSDPIAVVLGASSVDEAISSLDSLDRIADQDTRVIAEARLAKGRAGALSRALAARERELQRLTANAERSALAVEQARGQRAAYLAQLAGQRQLNAAAIASLEQQAQTVESKAQQLSAISSARGPAPGPVTPGRTLTVTATAYSIHGRTATGAPTGWGVVAVDPSVIPLGTRMTIPGYGSGVAADTGSAVRGNTIDLWFATLDQARAWGRRTVTITLG